MQNKTIGIDLDVITKTKNLVAESAAKSFATEATTKTFIMSEAINLPVSSSEDPLVGYLSLPNKNSYYANGLQAGLTSSESYFIFHQNSVPKVAVTVSLPTLKSMYIAIEKMLDDYERTFGQKILSSEELKEIALTKTQTSSL